MSPAATPDRLVTVDALRGLAVMGILLANLPAFALPESAYFSPLSAGGATGADRAAWLVNFIFVEGRMRALFSILFGASLLIVADRARASGRSAAAVHFPRMAVLFALGLAHLYLLWWGDILAHYALVGCVAFAFTRAPTPLLLTAAAAFLALASLQDYGGYSVLAASAARDSPQALATWTDFARTFGVPPPGEIGAEIAAMRGPWADQFGWRRLHAFNPFTFALDVGPQTLSAMLVGMAAYRADMLGGTWPRRRLLGCALACLPLSLAAYAVLGLATIDSGFDQRAVYLGSILASEPFRLLGAIGYAALALLLLPPGGWLTTRLAAVGRAAFSNYVGTSLLVTFIFYGWGLGLFATLPRAELYLFAPLVWLAMLAWSKPWLDRFAYGPLEWLWRSAARGRLQPFARAA